MPGLPLQTRGSSGGNQHLRSRHLSQHHNLTFSTRNCTFFGHIIFVSLQELNRRNANDIVFVLLHYEFRSNGWREGDIYVHTTISCIKLFYTRPRNDIERIRNRLARSSRLDQSNNLGRVIFDSIQTELFVWRIKYLASVHASASS